MSTPEGHYESISEVRKYLLLLNSANGELMTLNYYFSSDKESDLVKFIDSIKNEHFKNCNAKYIDITEDEEGIGKYSIVPFRRVKADAEVFWSEYNKYKQKCKNDDIIYGGICLGDSP